MEVRTCLGLEIQRTEINSKNIYFKVILLTRIT